VTFKKGDKVIDLPSGRIFVIKYMLDKTPVVNNGEFDFPLRLEVVIHWSPLMEELT
jgi:hypothetical protein